MLCFAAGLCVGCIHWCPFWIGEFRLRHPFLSTFHLFNSVDSSLQTTAAIMYSKLMRLLAKAQITFSSTLCVQFGKGNEGSTVRFGQLNFRASVAAVKLDTVNLLNDSDDDEKPAGSEEGYPVIEFRMVNDRANREKSEIWDATISGVVQVLKETPKDGEAAKASSKVTGGESTLDLEKVVYYVSDLMLVKFLISPVSVLTVFLAFVQPITLTPDSHPHFSRIWYARHVLNAESPLLKREFRDMIAQNGKWDEGTDRMFLSAVCGLHLSLWTFILTYLCLCCRFQQLARHS
jgi:hypothetical protein